MISYDPLPYTHLLEELMKSLQSAMSNYTTRTDTPKLNLVRLDYTRINCCAEELYAQPNSTSRTYSVKISTSKYILYYALSAGKHDDSTTNNHGVLPYYSSNNTSLPKNI